MAVFLAETQRKILRSSGLTAPFMLFYHALNLGLPTSVQEN